MSVENTTTKVVYAGNGVTKEWPVPFQYARSEDIALLIDDGTTQTDITSNYKIVVNESGDTSVTYPVSGTAVAAGNKLAIYRLTPRTQVVDLVYGGAFAPDVLENDGLDRIVMMTQELSRDVERAVKLAITSEDSPDALVASIYSSRDAAEVSAQAAANSASTAAQAVETATAEAVSAATAQANAAHDSALAAAQSAAEAAGASSGLAPRMDAVELVAASAKAVTNLATETPGAGGIPKADSNGKLDAWVTETPIAYATSSTAGSTAEKVASTTDTFTLHKGARVFVTFSNPNTVAGALTLNVNSTGAKAIYNEFGAVSSNNPMKISAGIATEFIYDGTNWTYQAAGGAYDYIGSAFRNLQAGSSINGSVVGSGVGSFCSLYANNSTGFTLPAGGTWFVFYFGANGSGNVEWASGRSYVMAGGSVVPVVSWASNGFAIRIK